MLAAKQKVANPEQIRDDFECLNEALVDHVLPVIDRPKAVLELWDLYDRIKKLEESKK